MEVSDCDRVFVAERLAVSDAECDIETVFVNVDEAVAVKLPDSEALSDGDTETVLLPVRETVEEAVPERVAVGDADGDDDVETVRVPVAVTDVDSDPVPDSVTLEVTLFVGLPVFDLLDVAVTELVSCDVTDEVWLALPVRVAVGESVAESVASSVTEGDGVLVVLDEGEYETLLLLVDEADNVPLTVAVGVALRVLDNEGDSDTLCDMLRELVVVSVTVGVALLEYVLLVFTLEVAEKDMDSDGVTDVVADTEREEMAVALPVKDVLGVARCEAVALSCPVFVVDPERLTLLVTVDDAVPLFDAVMVALTEEESDSDDDPVRL